jgi:hypothetical protein
MIAKLDDSAALHVLWFSAAGKRQASLKIKSPNKGKRREAYPPYTKLDGASRNRFSNPNGCPFPS